MADVQIDTAEILRNVTEKDSLFKTTVVSKEIDLTLDLGNLLAVDENVLKDKQISAKNNSTYLLNLNRDNVQILLNSIWELPSERVEDAILVPLPPPTTEIPREKPLPKAKKETKWEAYAKLKGIKSKKTEKLVWDKTHQEYRPAWGYKRANDETKDWMIEVPANADPFEDQYAKRKEAKSERVAKNEYQRLRNIAKNSKGKVPTADLAPSLKPSKEQVNLALSVAKTSTASVGKFTKALPRENEVKKPKGKKRKFESNTGSLSEEKERQLSVLNMMKNKQPRLNTDVAIKQNRKEEIEQRRSQIGDGKPMSKKLARKQAAILSGKKSKAFKGGKRKKGRK